MLTPPVKGLTVLGFDPAFRTGCKLAVVDQTGKFLAKEVIYPTEPQKKIAEAEKTLLELVKKFWIQLIVIGNWTASRESEKVVADFIKKNDLKTQYIITSEAGASVYSASKLAQDEYPDLDVTIRGAISIAHRVQDPLAELTKIDPKAIGVGQYQHDVDQKFLKEKLEEKVEDVVNAVGVDVNTASYTLLQYIAGLSTTVAKNLVAYRDENWLFEDKKQIKKVKGLWPKAYEQAIWFLRIKWGKEILDSTGIHPDNHKLWYETMQDILKELQRPGLDPREEIEAPCFKSDILDIKDVEIWMKLQGVVRNVTDFWAFVDVGLHNDGLVHKSQLANYFVQNPNDVVKVGQQVEVRVLDIDREREKLSLSMKDESVQANQPRKYSNPKPQKQKEIKNQNFWGSLSGNINFS